MFGRISGGQLYCRLSRSALHLLREGETENNSAGRKRVGGICHLTCEYLGAT